jgi:hypothetical protein
MELRRLAAASKDATRAGACCRLRRLDGMSRAEAAKIGGMDRRTPRD